MMSVRLIGGPLADKFHECEVADIPDVMIVDASKGYYRFDAKHRRFVWNEPRETVHIRPATQPDTTTT